MAKSTQDKMLDTVFERMGTVAFAVGGVLGLLIVGPLVLMVIGIVSGTSGIDCGFADYVAWSEQCRNPKWVVEIAYRAVVAVHMGILGLGMVRKYA